MYNVGDWEVVIAETGITMRDNDPKSQVAALWWALGQITEALRKLGEKP